MQRKLSKLLTSGLMFSVVVFGILASSDADTVGIDFGTFAAPWGVEGAGPITQTGIAGTAGGVNFTFDLTVEDNNFDAVTDPAILQFNGNDVLLREGVDNSSVQFTVSNISDSTVSFTNWLDATVFDNAGGSGANGPDELTFASVLNGTPSEAFSNPNLTFDAVAGTFSGPSVYTATFTETFSAPTLSVIQTEDGNAANTRISALSADFAVAVPEPSSAVALTCLGGLGLVRRRRR